MHGVGSLQVPVVDESVKDGSIAELGHSVTCSLSSRRGGHKAISEVRPARQFGLQKPQQQPIGKCKPVSIKSPFGSPLKNSEMAFRGLCHDWESVSSAKIKRLLLHSAP